MQIAADTQLIQILCRFFFELSGMKRNIFHPKCLIIQQQKGEIKIGGKKG